MKTANMDLHAHAQAVNMPAGAAKLSPRAVARCLSGVVSLVSRQWSVYEMQRVCAQLVRDASVWSSGFAVLPRERDGRINPALEQVAVIARGILPSCDVDAMKAALAFWAVESDPAVWQRVSGVAA